MVRKIFEFEGMGFKFSMLAKGFTEQSAAMPISKILSSMVEVRDVDGEKKFFDTQDTTILMLNILYGGAKAYAISKGTKEPNIDQVSDFVETLQPEQIEEMYTSAFKSYFPNAKAPEPQKEPGENGA